MALSQDIPPAEMTDERLIEVHRNGQDGAFEVLIDRYREELFHFLIRFTGDPAAADDLFQEAFLQVHLSAGSFDTSRRFRPWLFTIAANKARDRLRKEKRRAAASLSAPLDSSSDSATSFVDLLEADLDLPSANVENEETRQKVRQLVTTLPDHQREVLLLAYFHQFAYKQIAEMLGIPVGTVKSRLHAAVGSFAKAWKNSTKEH